MSETSKLCLICQTPFVVKTFDKTRAKYCSKECQKKAHYTYDKTLPSKIEKTCPCCNKKFTVWRSQSFRTYCSLACKKSHWAESGTNTGFLDLTGQVFERLTVIEYAGHKYGNHNAWHCVCLCGTKITTSTNALRSGSTKSCGCFARREGIEQPATYFCTKCDQEFPYTNLFFTKNKRFRWNLAPWCIPCMLPLMRKRHTRFRKRLKLEVLSHYSKGKPKCECCGVTGVDFLTLDHIDNNGKEDRKINGMGIIFYARMKRLGYPPYLRVLCFNCNIARSQSIDGICPHKRSREGC